MANLFSLHAMDQFDQLGFAKLLKHTREQHNLSQRALADSVHCARAHITHLEIGDRKPSYMMVRNLVSSTQLRLTRKQQREFYIAAGYTPVEEWHEVHEYVEDIMSNPNISDKYKRLYTTLVKQITLRMLSNEDADT